MPSPRPDHSGKPDPTSLHRLAKGLGIFSLALGAAELLLPRRLAASLGLGGRSSVVSAYGLREIATGLLVLLAKDPAPGIWLRVLGDALDVGTLALGYGRDASARRNILLATGSVSPVVLLDLYCALRLSQRPAARPALARSAGGYILYRDDVETIEPDEPRTHSAIIKVMTEGQNVIREKNIRERNDSRTIRVSHAKAHGLLCGKLVVDDHLPPELAQGLFAKAATYSVVVRISQAPSELTDDSKVSTPRGMAIKVFGVEGEHLPPFGHSSTQDFVFDTGKEFINGGVKAFLQSFKATIKVAPHLSQDAQGAVSTLNRVTNAALDTVGLGSGKLDFLGHPKRHPMEEPYYSQTPYRYGDYIAKFGVIPASPALRELAGQPYDPQTFNALREDTAEFFRSEPAEFDFVVQLNTDLEKMPIEDATVNWPEALSPFRRVARLVLPAQDAYSPELKNLVEGDYSFCPAHALAAHRPLGSINRARMVVYEAMSSLRRRKNDRPVAEQGCPFSMHAEH